MTRISCTSTRPENADYVEFSLRSVSWKLHDRHFPLARRSAAMVIQASSFKCRCPLFRAVTYLGRLGSWANRTRRTFSLVDVITSLISAITAGGTSIPGITVGLDGEVKVIVTLLPYSDTDYSMHIPPALSTPVGSVSSLGGMLSPSLPP